MIMKYNKILIIGLGVMTGINSLQACVTTLINDKGTKLFICNENNKVFIPIGRGESKRFGNAHQHAHFAIYMFQPKKQFWSRMYTCKQNGCGSTGNVKLKLSQIDDNTGDAHLFTITKHKPSSSMVQDLPMMKKKGCSSCTRR